MPHRIRLAGPWELCRRDAISPVASSPVAVQFRRFRLPATWSELAAALGSPVGTWEFRRIFHRPTGLAAGQRVWLMVESWPVAIGVSVNDEELGTVPANSGPQRWSVEDRLTATSYLRLEVAGELAESVPGDRLCGPCWLDIESD